MASDYLDRIDMIIQDDNNEECRIKNEK